MNTNLFTVNPKRTKFRTNDIVPERKSIQSNGNNLTKPIKNIVNKDKINFFILIYDYIFKFLTT